MVVLTVKHPPTYPIALTGFIARLRELSGNVALFSHGQFGSALAARWIGLAVIEAQHFALSPASISILAHEAGHPKVPVIALWNARADRSLSR